MKILALSVKSPRLCKRCSLIAAGCGSLALIRLSEFPAWKNEPTEILLTLLHVRLHVANIERCTCAEKAV